MTNRRCIFNLFAAFTLVLTAFPIVHGQEKSDGDIVNSLLAGLRSASPSEIALTVAKTELILKRLNDELSEQAIGVILTKELQLDRLASELRKTRQDAATMQNVEQSLRRVLPGRIQNRVNELRMSVAKLALLLSDTPDDLNTARQSIVMIDEHLRDPIRRMMPDGDQELRTAFRDLTKLHPSVSDMEKLRRQLSFANYASLIKKDFVTNTSKQDFEIPVHLRDCKDKTSIAVDGKVKICLSVELPPSVGENRILVHAHGTSQLNATADQSKIHLRANISACVQGTQGLNIGPTNITGDSPILSARLTTQLSRIGIDGLLGRCGLIEQLAARAVQKRLTANDRLLAEQIERSGQARVEEEGYNLAYRINGLLRHSIWDRMASLNFEPDIKLQNDSQGLRSDIQYARIDQLAALSPHPAIPEDIDRKLDMITWVHESAANNALDLLAGTRLDEATLRSLWQVELKLTNDDWERIQPARIPAEIKLAEQSPVAVRFLTKGVEILLQVTGCEIDGQVTKTVACQVRLRYRVEEDQDGLRFIRDEIDFSNPIPAEEKAIWLKTLDRLFAPSMRPLPKFRNAGFSSLFRIGYLNVRDGWVALGLARLPESDNSSMLTQQK